MNKNIKKIGAASVLAALVAGSSASALDIKSALLGAGAVVGVLAVSDVGFGKSPSNFAKEKLNAPQGLWAKYANRNNAPAQGNQ